MRGYKLLCHMAHFGKRFQASHVEQAATTFHSKLGAVAKTDPNRNER
jgi:hypothetical protein